jgi:hypothetical protein
MKTKERNLTMHTPYTAVNRKESGGSIWNLEDYAGYAVCDPQGHKIGRAEKLFLNGRGEPEYVRVKMGLFGIKTESLFPSRQSPQTRSGKPSCCSEAVHYRMCVAHAYNSDRTMSAVSQAPPSSP